MLYVISDSLDSELGPRRSRDTDEGGKEGKQNHSFIVLLAHQIAVQLMRQLQQL